jgi:hypothetical protein
MQKVAVQEHVHQPKRKQEVINIAAFSEALEL